ncbi:permease [Ktedonosporobacter rubrisoli]|nr:permease [Ktedonosporobacter rubrisoli]
MNLLSSALPWKGLLFFPVLLIFIGVLLFSTATLAFYVKQSLSFSKLRQAFERWPGLAGNILAALLGAATPFCTCTAVPLFLGMLEAEVALGPAVSFLLASPTINLGAIILLFVVFGWRIALFYAACCLIAAVSIGWLIGHFPGERALRDYLWFAEAEPVPASGRVALKKAAALGQRLTRKFLPWLVLATISGILIDILIPTTTVAQLGQWGVLAGIPLAALLGGVIYADILFLIPIGYALIQHGAAVPIVLTFMLADSGLSLPEIVVLSRILQLRIVLLFVAASLLVYILLGFGLLWL